MEVDELLGLGWRVAEVEARALGSPLLEPEHFLLAALKVVDPEFPGQLEQLDIETEKWKTICKDAAKLRRYLDILPDKVTEVRHRLRHRLARNAEKPLPREDHIHRSRKTCAAFFDAQCQAEGGKLTLLQLVHSMFELEFLEVNDMRWRGATQTRN